MPEGMIQRFGSNFPPGGETITTSDFQKEMNQNRKASNSEGTDNTSGEPEKGAEPTTEIELLREQNKLLQELLKSQREQMGLMQNQMDLMRGIADHFSGEVSYIKAAVNSLASIAERSSRSPY